VKRKKTQASSLIISDSSDIVFPSTPAKSLLLYVLRMASLDVTV